MAMTVARSVDVREVTSADGARRVEELFVSVWRTPSDQPPISADVLRALAHAGCYVAGAYLGDRLVGASAGFLGGAPDDVHLHSHITGVVPDAQGLQVGRTLKLHQRQWCLARGIGTVTWTFDPLVRRNGWFNLRRLGADIVAFERDFYGDMRDGVNAGDHSDRCLVRWDLAAPHEREPIPAEAAVAVLSVGADGRPVASEGDGDTRRIAVPADVDALRRTDPALARAWRDAFRDAFGRAFDDGLRVLGMTADGEYVLGR